MKYLRDGCKGAIDVKRRKKEVGQLEDEEAGKRGEKGAAPGQVSNSLERHDWAGKLDHSITLT
jgi:hypothetical protein